MVSGGTVRGDLNSVKSILANYSNSYSSISGSWKGMSCDNFMNKANVFVSEFNSALESCMNAYAEACYDYETYLEEKASLRISESNYSEALKAVNSGNTSETGNLKMYEEEVNTTKARIENLKEKINSNLAVASSNQLNSSVVSDGGSFGSTSQARISTSNGIDAAINWAVGIANDDSHGYSQDTRYGNPNYDCSSLVINAWDEAGVPVKDYGASYTGDMREAFLATGQFEWIPGDPSVEDLQAGDVLLSEGNHTELYIGDGQNVGALGDSDGYDGDSSGGEICVLDYYNFPWDGILRYKESDNNSE